MSPSVKTQQTCPTTAALPGWRLVYSVVCPSWGDPASVIASAIVKELGLHLTGTESIVEQTFYYFERKSILLIWIISNQSFWTVVYSRSAATLDSCQNHHHFSQRLNLQAEAIHKVKDYHPAARQCHDSSGFAVIPRVAAFCGPSQAYHRL